MKYTGLLLTLSVFAASSAFAIQEDYISGSCTLKLTGNDTTSTIGAKKARAISDLDESVIYHSDFRVKAKAREEEILLLDQKYEQIIPYADDPNQYSKFQAAVFADDRASKDAILENDVPYVIEPIKGTTFIKIEYAGKNEIFKSERDLIEVEKLSSVEAIDQYMRKLKRIPQVSVVVKGIKSGFGILKESFDKNGKAKIESSFEIPFVYTDYGTDGFWGVFSGDITELEAKEAKQKIHKSKVKLKCEFSLPKEIEDDSDRDEQNEISSEDVPVKKFKGNYSESRIIRKAVRN